MLGEQYKLLSSLNTAKNRISNLHLRYNFRGSSKKLEGPYMQLDTTLDAAPLKCELDVELVNRFNKHTELLLIGVTLKSVLSSAERCKNCLATSKSLRS